jgi:spore maturation protein SpmB
MVMIQEIPAAGAFWEPDINMTGAVNWEWVLDIAGLPSNITDMWFDEHMAEAGMTGFPIDLAKIYNPSGHGIPIDNGTMEFGPVEVHPEFSNLGYMTLDDPVFGDISVYRLGFRNASLENYVELWYYPAKGYLVGASIHTPPSIFELSFSLDMKSISVTDAQGDIDAMIDQVEQEKTYDQITQSIGGEEGGISQTLILALGAVAVAVIGVVAFMLLRKKKTV